MKAPSTFPPVRAPAPADGVANRHKLMMLIATGARMAVGLATFIVMARYLGPTSFGIIATAFAYATFAGIATDYGLAVSTIRLAAAAPEEAASITSKALATKTMLVGLASLVAVPLILIILPMEQAAIWLMIFTGTLAYSFGDLAMVAARARRRFETEAGIVIGTSIVMLALVSIVATLTQNSLMTAAAFMAGRIAYLLATTFLLKRNLGLPLSFRAPAGTVRQTLRASSSYAADSILSTLSNQLDVLIFSFLLTAQAIGIYQAGARLVQVIIPFAVVLSTVYMPALSATAAKDDGKDYHSIARRVMLEFAILALVGGAGFAIVGPWITPHFYGEAYRPLIDLWPGFALFVVWRFTAAGMGICLVAKGYVSQRIVSNLLNMLVLTVTAMLLVKVNGLTSASLVLALSALPSLLLYALFLERMKVGGHSALIALGISLLPLLTLPFFGHF